MGWGWGASADFLEKAIALASFVLTLTGTVKLGRKILYPLGKATGDRATIWDSNKLITIILFGKES